MGCQDEDADKDAMRDLEPRPRHGRPVSYSPAL